MGLDETAPLISLDEGFSSLALESIIEIELIHKIGNQNLLTGYLNIRGDRVGGILAGREGNFSLFGSYDGESLVFNIRDKPRRGKYIFESRFLDVRDHISTWGGLWLPKNKKLFSSPSPVMLSLMQRAPGQDMCILPTLESTAGLHSVFTSYQEYLEDTLAHETDAHNPQIGNYLC